ncbi:outer membrane protein [Alkalilimnicola ehrlichii MLHE-1]|uniref:Putative outer-membrane protein n=1 Tax=Alkalilimnicola ehrlichii (strain ATCC BAA-1101 / DSM 17681 / MLHE-1) TaxID=187272 RepID=Q0A8I8_ALKEH|nr:porin family protein [Alkalilimnicola ehrlichii]ABI56849.1 putative outer-membrane protein [Alkalilimnicola ehrlichii MLHE-1]
MKRDNVGKPHRGGRGAVASGLCAAAVAALLAGGPATALANNAFHGVYLGGQIGWAGYDTDIETDGDSIKGLAASGVSSGVLLGTGTVNDGWYFGFQGNFLLNNADASLGTDADLDVEESYGIDARLGRVISDRVLLYGLAGWQRTNAELSVAGVDKDDKDFDGFRFGAGVEMATQDNVFFRIEYTQTVYGSEDFRIDGDEVEADPHAQDFHLVIGYRF